MLENCFDFFTNSIKAICSSNFFVICFMVIFFAGMMTYCFYLFRRLSNRW